MIWPSLELEKAASLIPDNGELQVNLGDAYLNLGQDDKALAAFDHAVELSATPLVWNNIAYQLSLKDSHLDRAQQYAESAVSATAAALRNVSLDRLSNRELPLVKSLIAYWDTLGWVHFGEGDLTRQKNMSLPHGNSAITARSATIWVRSIRSEATKTSPCAPMLCP